MDREEKKEEEQPKCGTCGHGDRAAGPCPYNEEIFNDSTPCARECCHECRHECMMET